MPRPKGEADPVVLAGQLQLGGQSMLALEQARRLPHIKTWSGRRAFSLDFAFAIPPQPNRTTGPLEPLLKALDIPVHKFYTQIPGHLVREWGRGNTTNRLSSILAAARHLDDLAEDVRGIIQPFVDVVQGADIFSFTNHENHRHDDRTMVEAARRGRASYIVRAVEPLVGLAADGRRRHGVGAGRAVALRGPLLAGARRVDGRGGRAPGLRGRAHLATGDEFQQGALRLRGAARAPEVAWLIYKGRGGRRRGLPAHTARRVLRCFGRRPAARTTGTISC